MEKKDFTCSGSILCKLCESELTASICKRKDGAVFHHYSETKSVLRNFEVTRTLWQTQEPKWDFQAPPLNYLLSRHTGGQRM